MPIPSRIWTRPTSSGPIEECWQAIGLLRYNTRNGTFGANFRLRWEWAPGSELFVVYTENRNTDVLDRWSDLSGRTLVVKATRLVRF